MGLEAVSANFESSLQFAVVINLAVEYYGDRALFVRDGLGTAREINY